jgi:hypothetical protein
MSDIEKYITDEMRQMAGRAYSQGLQNDLRVLADRIRSEAPPGSDGFSAGIDWAVLFIENLANQLTE